MVRMLTCLLASLLLAAAAQALELLRAGELNRENVRPLKA